MYALQITVTIAAQNLEGADLLSLDVFPDMTIETLQSSIQAETRVDPSAQHLYHDGQLITDTAKTLQELHITDGDMIALHVRERTSAPGRSPSASGRAGRSQLGGGAAVAGAGSAASPASAGAAAAAAAARRRPGEPDPEMIRLQILGDPRLREEPAAHERRERLERQRQIAQLNADPFDVEAQARIEEIIRQERVMENLQNAMEHNPEVFGRVHMLYVDVEVNGFKVKALVDSGAQATIMSPSCAEACGIMRLVDKRFAGVARGVGTATIIGRVHSAQIKIGTLFLPCSFTVMEGKSVDLLIGLDMLKRYQASIDLAKDRLIIQGVEIPFLGEADIPKDSEEALTQEPTLPGPSGTTIGQRSGAVSGPEGEGEGQGGGGSGSTGQGGPSAAVAAAAAGGRPQQQAQTQPALQSTSAPAPAQQRQQQQPQQQQQPAPGAQPAGGGQSSIPEEAIQQLMALGFPREAAIQSLQATGGNVEYAASLLFQG
ncbi:hypothetical protein SPI_05750 [Niveomyces insectorum RCEF 264]|uniref:DNA damage-inducible protein 1 n=1 Tax=Niveomyces insectorum RCEF 264 TaxID=1081102 RepID=A0A167SEL4_9HYPO|nr:hypothetical protein SPI_05750 [Niveomyces insectorum RCEF 264]